MGVLPPPDARPEQTGLVKLVAGAGLEPATSELWARRAASCSIPQRKNPAHGRVRISERKAPAR